jgi:hypothetical protein
VPCRYPGWSVREARLELIGDSGPPLRPLPLVWSAFTPPEGLTAPVLDLGRGAPEDFERSGGEIAGKIVMVEGDYPFSTSGIHRRQKFLEAINRGASGFLIASWVPGGFATTGSSRPEGSPIPALGVSPEDASRISAHSQRGGKARIVVQGQSGAAETAHVMARVPGRGTGRRIVVSAHYDGHAAARSAMDNATGAAVTLELARVFSRLAGRLHREVQLCLFTVEEWGLLGSRAYVESLSAADLDAIDFNLNLDTVAGSPNLTVFVNGFDDLAAFVEGALKDSPESWRVSPLVAKNSDHVNFLRKGIPSVRVLAGVDEPGSNCRFVLTTGDTENRVARSELTGAARLAARLLLASCTCEGPIARRRSVEEAEALLDFGYGIGMGRRHP